MGKPEGIIEDYLIKQSKQHDAICWKFVSPGQRGVPDRIVIYNGQVHFVELKSEDGNLSEQQKTKIKLLQKHKANVHVLNSKKAINQFFNKLTALPKQKTTPWICTDNDCMQHLKAVNNYEYLCIQIEEQPARSDYDYRITSGYVDLRDYTIDDLNSILKPYYAETKKQTPLEQIWHAYTEHSHNLQESISTCNQIIAECIFESIDDKNILEKNMTWNEAAQIIKDYIKTN